MKNNTPVRCENLKGIILIKRKRKRNDMSSLNSLVTENAKKDDLIEQGNFEENIPKDVAEMNIECTLMKLEKMNIVEFSDFRFNIMNPVLKTFIFQNENQIYCRIFAKHLDPVVSKGFLDDGNKNKVLKELFYLKSLNFYDLSKCVIWNIDDHPSTAKLQVRKNKYPLLNFAKEKAISEELESIIIETSEISLQKKFTNKSQTLKTLLDDVYEFFNVIPNETGNAHHISKIPNDKRNFSGFLKEENHVYYEV